MSDPFENAESQQLPPHSVEAEQGVLGCHLWDGRGADLAAIHADTVLALGEEPEKTFHDLRHRIVMREIGGLVADRKAVDIITLRQRLKDAGELDHVGGLAYLNTLQDSVPSPANLNHYLDIVREKALLRNTRSVCESALKAISDAPGGAEEVLDQIEQSFAELRLARQVGQGERVLPDLVNVAIERIEEAFKTPDGIYGLETGIQRLDDILQGLKPGKVYCVAARPSCGKTSLALQIAEHNAVNRDKPVGVIEIEMTAEELVEQLIHTRALTDSARISDWQDRDFSLAGKAAAQIRNKPLYISDRLNNWSAIQSKCRGWVASKGVELIVIDYLQLVRAKAKSREGEIEAVSQGVKQLAKELNVPIILVSQMNRDVEKGEKRRPQLTDLRGSGSIEQDVDAVIFVWDHKDDESATDDRGHYLKRRKVTLSVAKHRGGRKGGAAVWFVENWTRFQPRGAEKESEE